MGGVTMAEDLSIFLSMKDDYLAEKKLDYRGYAATKLVGFSTKQKDGRIFSGQDFITYLKKKIKLSRYKSKQCLDILVSSGLVKMIDDDTYKIENEKKPFLNIDVMTVYHFFNNYQAIHFKVYCYLLNKFNIHNQYHHKENYFFSTAELLRMAGYDDRQGKNFLMMNDVLNTLENGHFIKYNHHGVSRNGKHGTYKELYYVNPYSEGTKQAVKDTKQDIKDGNVSLGLQWYNGQTWIDFEDGLFEDINLLDIVLRSVRNRDFIEQALKNNLVPEENKPYCEKYLRKFDKR